MTKERYGPTDGNLFRMATAAMTSRWTVAIGLAVRALEDQPWFWTITAREQPPSVYNHGYAASREQAMRYFKART